MSESALPPSQESVWPHTTKLVASTGPVPSAMLLRGFLVGGRDVGLYAVPYRFCFLLVAAAAVIHISYLPAFTRACAGGRRELADLAGRSAQLSSALGAPIVIGGIVLG